MYENEEGVVIAGDEKVTARMDVDVFVRKA